ncbi:MAG: NIPSNAP family protein [Acidimicrobiia bacterium]|nr:NIPSNAP family protein [Acidimicrobiia bacterium]
MFVEMRQYVFHTGGMGKYVELLKARGHAIVRRHLGDPLAFYTTEIGDTNTLVHLWQYESFEDRAARRAAMNADPEWQQYLTEILPLIQQQTSTILNPVDLPL